MDDTSHLYYENSHQNSDYHNSQHLPDKNSGNDSHGEGDSDAGDFHKLNGQGADIQHEGDDEDRGHYVYGSDEDEFYSDYEDEQYHYDSAIYKQQDEQVTLFEASAYHSASKYSHSSQATSQNAKRRPRPHHAAVRPLDGANKTAHQANHFSKVGAKRVPQRRTGNPKPAAFPMPLMDEDTRVGIQMSRLKIAELQNENVDLKRQMKAVVQELKTLQRQNKLQDKEISKIQNQEADMPNVVQRLMEDIHVLQTQLRRVRERHDQVTRQNKQLEAELSKNKSKLNQLLSLAEDTELEERDILARQVTTLHARLEIEEKRNRELEYNLELIQKNHRHELQQEMFKQKALRKEHSELKSQLATVEMQLKEKTKILEMNHIYSAQRRAGDTHSSAGQAQKPPLAATVAGRNHQIPAQLPASHSAGAMKVKAKVVTRRHSLQGGSEPSSESSEKKDAGSAGHPSGGLRRKASMKSVAPVAQAEDEGAGSVVEMGDQSTSLHKDDSLGVRKLAATDASALKSRGGNSVTSAQEDEEEERRRKEKLLAKLKDLDSKAEKISATRHQQDSSTSSQQISPTNFTAVTNSQPAALKRETNLFITENETSDDDILRADAQVIGSPDRIQSGKVRDHGDSDVSSAPSSPSRGPRSASSASEQNEDHDSSQKNESILPMIHQGAPGLSMANHRRRQQLTTKSPMHYTGESLDLEEMHL